MMFSLWGRLTFTCSNKYAFCFSLYLIVAELIANWVINTSNIDAASVRATWPYYSPSLHEELFLYAVVCTPTLGEAGPTILTVDSGVTSSKIERLRPYTNYTAQVIALVKTSPWEGISFQGSEEAYFETDEGGE